MPLIDIARTDVATAAPETRVGDVAAAMRDADLSVIAILDEQRPVGLLTAEAIGRAYVAGEDLDEKSAADLAETVPAVSASGDLSTLLAEFEAAGGRRAVVLDESGAFAGLVTLEDALVRFGRDLETVFSLLERADGG
ncbi:CBS domain-containing protein [Halegenticoccus tardaugens]|uniref:CBS domain-containing protein n=1 Tax=Halegenticoccus tardaugens TaxID=2071624 RepID=UPI00100B1943|nr:CBS domain-containing protein [Halegenticoccus tardaugens]